MKLPLLEWAPPATAQTATISWKSFLLMTAGLLVGCGQVIRSEAKQTVAGEVKINGKPLSYGLVEFCRYDAAGKMEVEAATIMEGRFELAASAGEYLVRVSPAAPEIGEMDSLPAEKRKQMIDAGAKIPERYHSVSDLRVTVESNGNNAPVIDLQTKETASS
jgi:hypothetical protein